MINAINKEHLRRIISRCLSENELLYCDKVWYAWGYGTMRDDNFHDAGEDDDIVENIVNEIIKEMEN